MNQIKQYALDNENDDILSIQMFAGHGMIYNGSQVVLTNNFDNRKRFYEFLQVETCIKYNSKRQTNVYYITLFACARENFVLGKKIGKAPENRKKVN